MKLWVELAMEFLLVVLAGVLTYNLCRSVYSMPEAAAGLSAAVTAFLVVVGVYSGHRLRRLDLLSLPTGDRFSVAWRSIRSGLRAAFLALVSACCGYGGLYLMRRGNVSLGLLVTAVSVLFSTLALFAVIRAWREMKACPTR